MKKSTQYGKGLAGFFFGLILATGIIAGILFFLNQGNQNVFKELTLPATNPPHRPFSKSAPRR